MNTNSKVLGSDLINDKSYDEDRERMRNYINWTIQQIKSCKKSVEKFQNKVIKYETQFEDLKKMTIKDWAKAHPKKN